MVVRIPQKKRRHKLFIIRNQDWPLKAKTILPLLGDCRLFQLSIWGLTVRQTIKQRTFNIFKSNRWKSHFQQEGKYFRGCCLVGVVTVRLYSWDNRQNRTTTEPEKLSSGETKKQEKTETQLVSPTQQLFGKRQGSFRAHARPHFSLFPSLSSWGIITLPFQRVGEEETRPKTTKFNGYPAEEG